MAVNKVFELLFRLLVAGSVLLHAVISADIKDLNNSKMAPVVERVVDSVHLGEGPHWDVSTQSLYFVDIFGKAIHKYVPSTKKHTKAVIGSGHVSLIVPVEGQKDKFLISIGRKLAVVTWDGESDKVSKTEEITEVDNKPDTLDNRFNDGKCDPSGRLWAGTMGGEPENGAVKREKGALFSLVKGQAKQHLSKIGISNGLAWTTDNKTMYYIDSHKGYLEQFDFDIVNGTISNSRNVFTLSKHGVDGVLDGMCIDTDGNLWVAIFNGYRVIKIDPRKPETLLQTVEIPAKQVNKTTSVAFGGPNLDELYVTSASFTVNGVELPPPDHGATFRVTGLGVKGFPDPAFGFSVVNGKPKKMTDKMIIRPISESLEVGTRPCWDAEKKCLYFVDVPTSYAYKYDNETGETVKTKVAQATTKYIPKIIRSPINLLGVGTLLQQIPITICPLDGEQLEVGTRPFWDEDRQILYFVDVKTSTIYKYCYNGNRVAKATVGDEPLAFMFPVEGDDKKFIAGLGRKLVFVTWDGKCPVVQKVELITEVEWEEDYLANRWNGGKVDPYGRLWAGTMGPADENGDTIPGRGSLYSYSKGLLLKHETNIGISNGLAWDVKENKMYYIDTLFPGVYQYDYDPKTGTICNRTCVFDFENNFVEGKPDGLVIDMDGNLIVACIFGGHLIHFDPRTGKVLARIPIPAEQVTAVTFGGFELDKLFVTTAKMEVNGEVPEDPAGVTFVIEGLGISGLGDFKYKP
ncbi:unnamed protein product [Brassicogethes aeneus]|uniref:Regucalcin n=1 Tax=Brassicogethes aeneus TaxID=1431903 RepID=A0A9P0B4Q4_BRAAE|nr:unnamed protein product [Brassicogethes aeneus]